MDDDKYYTIQGWMVKRMELTGNELLAYALIYGFTKDFKSRFTGSLDFICKSLNVTKNTAKKALDSLVAKELIIKTDVPNGNIKYCEYHCCKKAYDFVQQEINENVKNNKDNFNKKKLKTTVKNGINKGIAEIGICQNLTQGIAEIGIESIAESAPNNHVYNYIKNHVHEENLELDYFENVFNELGVNFTKFNQTSVKKLLRTLPKEKVINYLKETFENIKNTPGVNDTVKVFCVKISKGERQPIYQAPKRIVTTVTTPQEKISKIKKEIFIPEPIKVSPEYEMFLTFPEDKKNETIQKAKLKFAEKIKKETLNRDQEKVFAIEGIRNALIVEVLKDENIIQYI